MYHATDRFSVVNDRKDNVVFYSLCCDSVKIGCVYTLILSGSIVKRLYFKGLIYVMLSFFFILRILHTHPSSLRRKQT